MGTKAKYSLEYVFDSCSLVVLWNSISTPLGLEEWFADKVTSVKDGFIFEWEDTKQQADIVAVRVRQGIRFRWHDDTDGSYFEFKINRNELTNQVTLVITDFAIPEEKEDSVRLWNSQVETLRHNVGM